MTTEQMYKRLTPAHISLCGWQPRFEQTRLEDAEIKKSKNKIVGDRVVASKELAQGKAILQEIPFIKQLDDRNLATHCASCFSLLKKTKEPCRNKQCQWKNLYCSITCQRQHWSAEHKWLCHFPELTGTDKDVLFAFQGYLACRSIGKNTLPELVSNMDAHKPEEVEEYNKKINNSQLKSVFYLSEGVVEAMVTIMAQIRCNTFAVKHYITFKSMEVEERECITVGRSIYLSASKFNHSCNPNALVLFGVDGIGSHMKIHLIGNEVEKGSEINISYGPLATRISKDERKKKLKHDYFFDCSCSSCQLDYDPVASIYRCQQCRTGRLSRFAVNCRRCGFRPNWAIITKTENVAKGIQEKAKAKDDMDLFSKALKIMSEIYVEESLPLGEWWDNVASMHAKNNNFYEASMYVKQSISTVQKVFGYTSPEVAEEMCKLTGLLQRSYQVMECYHTAMAAISLFKTLGLDESRQDDFKYLKCAAYLTRYVEDKKFLEE